MNKFVLWKKNVFISLQANSNQKMIGDVVNKTIVINQISILKK